MAIHRPSLSWVSQFENKHVSFCSEDGRQTLGGVLRFVGQVTGATKRNVAGIVLDEPHPVRVKTSDGVYQGVKVIECPRGYGLVLPLEDFEKMVLKVASEGHDFWICKECCHVNPTPQVSSLDEYLNMPVEILDVLLRCPECNTVRVWLCPFPTCLGLPGLEVADIRGAVLEETADTDEPKVVISSVHETLTCPRCMRCPLNSWPCPQCNTRNFGYWCDTCAANCEPLVPQRDSMMLLHWLRNPHLQMSTAWSRILTPSEAVAIASGSSGRRPFIVDDEDPMMEVMDDVDEEKASAYERSVRSASTRRTEDAPLSAVLTDICADREKLRTLRRALLEESRDGRRPGRPSGIGRTMPWEIVLRDQKYETKAPTDPVYISDDGLCGHSRRLPTHVHYPNVAADSAQGRSLRAKLAARHNLRKSHALLPYAYEENPSRRMPETIDALFSPVHGRSGFDVERLTKTSASGSLYGSMRKLIQEMGDTYDDGHAHSSQSRMLASSKHRSGKTACL